MSVRREPAIWFPAIRAGTGADIFTERLCDGLKARGLRAEIAWLPHRAEYLPWSVAAPRAPAWANVVHVNSWLPRRFWPVGLPVVVTVHHLVHDPAYHPYRSAMQAAYHELLIRRRELNAIRDAAAVATVSDYVRATVASFSGRKQIAVIHNWVDGKKFSPDPCVSSSSNGGFRLFMAGSRSRRKGIDLLPAFANELGPGFEIRHAGGRQGGVQPVVGVTELGRVSEDELIREYRACDAVVSLSRYEGFGYTALEAMACGKPVVGFRCGAIDEVVVDGETGLLCGIDDLDALGKICRRLAGDAPMACTFGQAGRGRATSIFAEVRAIDAYMTIYQSLMVNDEGRKDGCE